MPDGHSQIVQSPLPIYDLGAEQISDNDCPPGRALDTHRNHCLWLLRLALARHQHVISGRLLSFAPSSASSIERKIDAARA